MSDETPRLKLPQLVSLQEMSDVTWNEALAQLDVFVDLCLLGQYVNTPPANPADGDAYLVGAAPTGAWSGYAYKIATCLDGAWRFHAPCNGLRAFVASNSAFIVYLNGTWVDWNALIGGSEASIASSATTDLGAAAALFVQITGTTAITSFGAAANKLRFVRFAQALVLTHNASSLILLGAANRTTAAGDVGIYASDAGGNWRERAYFRAATNPGDVATKSGAETLSNKTFSGATAFPNGVIDASGNLSIGTASPASGYQLTVASTGNPFVQFNGGAGLAGGFFYFNGTTGGSGFTFFSAADSRAFAFLNNTLSNAHAPIMVMQNQAVGIGDGITPRSGAMLDVGGNIYPHTDNACNLGSGSYRFGTVYAATATINTSGAGEKHAIRPPNAEEIAAAKELAGNVRIFRFVEAVAKKGEAARLHAGFVAEEVFAVFTAHGLDPFRYGICCRDPVMTPVRLTRLERRRLPAKQNVAVERETITVENGRAVLRREQANEQRDVFEEMALVTPDGAPVLDAQGRPRTHRVPVMQEVEETMEQEGEQPDLDASGAPKYRLGLRTEELVQFVLAGLAARLEAAFTAV